jgi:hypothetical protein
MTNNEKLKDALKRIEVLEEKVDELENACAEHEGWIRKLQQWVENFKWPEGINMFTRLS